MTQFEADEILSYVAQNLISPLAFDSTPAKEVWLRLSGKDFNQFCAFVQTFVNKENNYDDRK